VVVAVLAVAGVILAGVALAKHASNGTGTTGTTGTTGATGVKNGFKTGTFTPQEGLWTNDSRRNWVVQENTSTTDTVVIVHLSGLVTTKTKPKGHVIFGTISGVKMPILQDNHEKKWVCDFYGKKEYAALSKDGVVTIISVATPNEEEVFVEFNFTYRVPH
jgi:hypothetical protein